MPDSPETPGTAPLVTPKPHLTEKQENFCKAYISNGHDATSAVIAAGYDTTYPGSLASQILRSKAVRRRITELEGLPPVLSASNVSKQDLLDRMAAIAFQDAQAKPADRIAALKALGANLGLFGGDQREDTGTQSALVAAIEVMRKMPTRDLEEFIGTFKASEHQCEGSEPPGTQGDAPETDPEGLEL